MKKIFCISMLLAFLTGSGAAFAGPQDFTLVNGSASHICYVFISESNNNNWEDDVLNADQCLAPGESIKITFSGYKSSSWDLRVADENGNYEDYHGFNLNSISQIKIEGGGEASYR